MQTLLASVIWFFALVSLASGFQTSDANMFRGNPLHTGTYESKSIRSLDGVAWRFSANGAIRSTPLISDNVIYFGSSDNFFYAVDIAMGTERWRFETGGAVTSSPAVANGAVYFSSRDGKIYALDVKNGKTRWSFEMGPEAPYAWEFDYYLSSPTIVGGSLFIGSGDGNVYALEAASGKLQWKYPTRCRVRSSPAVDAGVVYVGDVVGRLHAIDAETGKRKWVFEIAGAAMNPADFGFDRQAIISSPSLTPDLVLVGGRDGFLYAVNRESGTEQWRFDHKVSWVISTPAIHDGVVYAGTSDGQFIQAVELATGKEKWRAAARGPVWASPTVVGDAVYAGSFGGILYALDRETGAPLWDFRSGGILSSVIAHNEKVYFGSDDGNLYALVGSNEPSKHALLKRAVFWVEAKGFSWFRKDRDLYLRGFFEGEGYEVLNDTSLASFMADRLADGAPSVIVFASNFVPNSVLAASGDVPLLRRFLEKGRVVFLGPQPLAYVFDPQTGAVTGLDYSVPEKMLGIRYGGPDTRGYRGIYMVTPTAEGRRRGLESWWIGVASVDTSQVTTVLATDEVGRAGAWEKTFGGPKGTGLLQLWANRDLPDGLMCIKRVSEFGL
jgi:outer membrane protein assembly factor BamB